MLLCTISYPVDCILWIGAIDPTPFPGVGHTIALYMARHMIDMRIMHCYVCLSGDRVPANKMRFI